MKQVVQRTLMILSADGENFKKNVADNKLRRHPVACRKLSFRLLIRMAILSIIKMSHENYRETYHISLSLLCGYWPCCLK